MLRDLPGYMKEFGLSINTAGTSWVRPGYQLSEFLGSSHNDNFNLLVS
jgi:hypothetical protein